MPAVAEGDRVAQPAGVTLDQVVIRMIFNHIFKNWRKILDTGAYFGVTNGLNVMQRTIWGA